ncbi:DUF2493 domain-containing protein [Xanthocytophaga flava]|uniref:DUF2493 domain-containing protein n=1 Tax=Xanthocytophaga flava TaxID=3048013 RepID=UPI0028D645E0|nr:DUF2493 domain-containing protein [Xanthocytophaga flavus]MDJ1466963.1 DUF2493 domain-containing protein [Xanthocytophaga flavus]
MKLAITGSRSIEHCTELLAELERLPITELIHGGAVGVDQLAANWATAKGIKVTEIKPDYQRYGAGAPHIRNAEIIQRADKVLACWDGESKGTASTIKKADAKGKLLKVILYRNVKQPELLSNQIVLF